MRNTHTRFTFASAAVGLAAILAAFAFLLWSRVDAQPAPSAKDAVAAGTAAGDRTAATVNGTPVSLASVQQAQIMSEVMGGPAQDALSKPGAALDNAIRSELLFQEAARRGLVPADAVVREEVLRQQASLQKLLASPAADPRLKQVQRDLAGTGFSVDEYASSPKVFAAFQRAMAIAALTKAITADLPPAARTEAAVAARVNALYQQLRAKADVKVLISP